MKLSLVFLPLKNPKDMAELQKTADFFGVKLKSRSCDNYITIVGEAHSVQNVMEYHQGKS